MRALEALAAHIEYNQTGERPIVPTGAVTLADVDQAIADERRDALREEIDTLVKAAEHSRISKAEQARRLCAVAGALRDCGAFGQALDTLERARRLDRRAVTAKALNALRIALAVKQVAAESAELFIVDALPARRLYGQLASSAPNATLLEQAIALRKLGVDTARWTKSAYGLG
jgi:tetratricopeptide (TPR) repeat protein